MEGFLCCTLWQGRECLYRVCIAALASKLSAVILCSFFKLLLKLSVVPLFRRCKQTQQRSARANAPETVLCSHLWLSD